MKTSSVDYLLRLPKFNYFAPKTIDEACRLLSKYAGEAKILAGGTDLLASMKQKKTSPNYLINIKGIRDLDYILFSEELGLRIGALATLQSLVASPIIGERFEVLRSAVSKIGMPQVRNMATLVGNVCNAGPSQDSVPALLVSAARLKVVNSEGERIVPIEQFFIGPFQTVLKPAELVTEIQVPTPPPRSAGIYQWVSKLSEVDETLVGVAVLLVADHTGKMCQDIRVGLCSVAPTPIRATAAEEVLRGQKVDEKHIELAAKVAAAEISPRSRAEYRRHMTEVLLKKALADAWEKIRQSDVSRGDS